MSVLRKVKRVQVKTNTVVMVWWQERIGWTNPERCGRSRTVLYGGQPEKGQPWFSFVQPCCVLTKAPTSLSSRPEEWWWFYSRYLDTGTEQTEACIKSTDPSSFQRQDGARQKWRSINLSHSDWTEVKQLGLAAPQSFSIMSMFSSRLLYNRHFTQ